MERIFIIDHGDVLEYDKAALCHYVGKESTYKKGPSLPQKRVIILQSAFTKSVHMVFVQTHTNLYEHLGYVLIHGNEMPTTLHLKDGYETMPIENGSLIYEALQSFLRPIITLAEEVCKAQ